MLREFSLIYAKFILIIAFKNPFIENIITIKTG